MDLTQKIHIFPTDSQLELMWILSEKNRLIYNFALDERIENWKENKNKPKKDRKYINYKDQQNQLPNIKEKYPEY
ncbi:MAG: helix-turn-helix domain-containing protein, partial [Promethearchaeota archaeon]